MRHISQLWSNSGILHNKLMDKHLDWFPWFSPTFLFRVLWNAVLSLLGSDRLYSNSTQLAWSDRAGGAEANRAHVRLGGTRNRLQSFTWATASTSNFWKTSFQSRLLMLIQLLVVICQDSDSVFDRILHRLHGSFACSRSSSRSDKCSHWSSRGIVCTFYLFLTINYTFVTS